MQLLSELFGTWVGLLSLLVIVGVFVIAIYMYRFVVHKIEAEEAAGGGRKSEDKG